MSQLLKIGHVERPIAGVEQFEVVRDQKHGAALVGLFAENPGDRGEVRPVETARRFVEKQKFGSGRNGAGNRGALLLTAREGRRAFVAVLRQAEALEEFVGAPRGFRLRPAVYRDQGKV